MMFSLEELESLSSFKTIYIYGFVINTLLYYSAFQANLWNIIKNIGISDSYFIAYKTTVLSPVSLVGGCYPYALVLQPQTPFKKQVIINTHFTVKLKKPSLLSKIPTCVCDLKDTNPYRSF